MRTYEVFFEDGNRKLYEAKDFVSLMQWLINYEPENEKIYRIKEVRND